MGLCIDYVCDCVNECMGISVSDRVSQELSEWVSE